MAKQRKQRQRQQQQEQQPHLPHEVLTLVLQPIKQRQRLRSCSLVCRAWRAAAAAATTAISQELAARSSSSLTQWLRAHGGNLTQLKLTSSSACALRVPLVQLTQLRSCRLDGFLLQAEPAAAAAGSSCGKQAGSSFSCAQGSSKQGASRGSHPLCHLSSLTKLSLSHILIDSFFIKGGLRNLSLLTALQDLALGNDIKVHCDANQQQEHLLCLQQLTQLTRIELDPCYLPTAAAAPFSALQQLQRLELKQTLRPEQAARLLAELPASLTHLQFDWAGKQQLGLSNVPGIASLTALHTLCIRRWWCDKVSGRGLNPLLLARMQQLQVLELGWLGSGALPALLQVMPQLSSLRQLDLECGAVKALPASDAARYSDLLPASQHLSKVVLRGTARMLPDARYGCNLFVGRHLPRLQQLAFGWDPEAGEDPTESADDLPPPFLDSEAMQAMAGCCPALRTLLATGCVTGDAQLAPLQQLTALSELFLAGDEIDDEFAEQQLTLLGSLRHLHVYYAAELTDAGVAQWTALTGLRSLSLYSCGISQGMEDPNEEGVLELRFRRSTGESVLQQLRRRCRRAALLAALEAEEQGGNMEAPGALQALLGAHCGSCQQLREQLEAAQARADAAEAEVARMTARWLMASKALMKTREELDAAKAKDQQLR